MNCIFDVVKFLYNFFSAIGVQLWIWINFNITQCRRISDFCKAYFSPLTNETVCKSKKQGTISIYTAVATLSMPSSIFFISTVILMQVSCYHYFFNFIPPATSWSSSLYSTIVVLSLVILLTCLNHTSSLLLISSLVSSTICMHLQIITLNYLCTYDTTRLYQQKFISGNNSCLLFTLLLPNGSSTYNTILCTIDLHTIF